MQIYKESNIISDWTARKWKKCIGSSPFNDGTTLAEPRESYPIPMAPERPEEFSPGLDPEIQALADALTDFKERLLRQQRVV